MSNVVNQLLETANPYKSVQKDAAKLSGKWEKSGLLEGISNETDKSNMSIMLENQAKQLVVEANTTGTGGTFTPGTGEQYAAVALPLVRKVFGQIAAKEFVSVQPMNLPSGLVFFLDFQYGTTKNQFTSGNSMYGSSSANFGNTSTGGLYGAGRFSYSTNDSASLVACTTASVDWYSDFNADSDYSASVGQYKKVTVAYSLLANVDLKAVRSFQLHTGSFSTGTGDQVSQFTKVDGSNIVFYVSSSVAPVQDSNITIEYTQAPTDGSRGDFEDGNTNLNGDNSSPISIPEINVQMKSEAIVAKTKKLKAVWTPEFSQEIGRASCRERV